MKLDLFDKIFTHKIQIVNENLPILTDGIIGHDIFNKLLAKIDYETFTATNDEVTIPMKTRIFKDFVKTVPKRSEAIHHIYIIIKSNIKQRNC